MKLFTVTIALFLIHTANAASEFSLIPVVPNLQLTPGVFCSEQDKDFKEFRYLENMPYCQRKVDKSDKIAAYRKYNIDLNCKHRYTVDHFIPLALGGNNDDNNLWPEHVLVKATRETLELELYQSVVDGEMTSEEAVEIIIREKTQLELDLSHVEGCG